MSLDEEIATLLGTLGLGTYLPDAVGGTIFLGDLPPDPDVAIAVRLYGGTESDSKLPYDTSSVQFKVRGDIDFRTAKNRAQAVYDQLHGLSTRDLAPGGTWLVLCVGINGGPVYLGTDDLGRHEHAVNFRMELERHTAHRT